MKQTTISHNNQLQHIIDFDYCKNKVEKAIRNNESMVILCPHYSINVQSKYDDGEELQWDMDELSDYIGGFVEVNDYDDMIVNLDNNEE